MEIFGKISEKLETSTREPNLKFDPDKLIEPGKSEALDTAPRESTAGAEIDPDKLIYPGKARDVSQEKRSDTDSKLRTGLKRILDIGEPKLYSDRETRYRLASYSDGEWSGAVGDSKFTPNDPDARKAMEECGKSSIRYRNGVVDFSPYAKETVSIEMTPCRCKNREMAYKALAQKWNDIAKDGHSNWTARAAEAQIRSQGLIFHECNDLKTVYFVSEDIHKAAQHSGGCYEAKCKKILENGGSLNG